MIVRVDQWSTNKEVWESIVGGAVVKFEFPPASSDGGLSPGAPVLPTSKFPLSPPSRLHEVHQLAEHS